MTVHSVQFVAVCNLPDSVRQKLLADGKIDHTTHFVEITVEDAKRDEVKRG
jgi:hypothetical protein